MEKESNAPETIRPLCEIVVMEYNKFRAAGSPVFCGCGDWLISVSMVRDHWQQGHFDYVEPQPQQAPPVGQESIP